MKVLITGGAGFIGQHLARRLVATGHQVLALDNLLGQVHLDPETSRRSFPGPVIVGDVSEPSAWDDVRDAALPLPTTSTTSTTSTTASGSGSASPSASVSSPALDAVVHLAAETGTGQSMYEVDRYRRVNMVGTRLAGEFAERHGIPLVAVSSRAVYGEGRHHCPDHEVTFGPACCAHAIATPSQESDAHHPVSVYGQTKSEGEHALDSVAQTVPVTTLRPQNVIGPGQALHNPYTGVLAAFLAMLKEGKPLTIYGAGTQTRDFLHVDDLTSIIGWALDHPGEIGAQRILNAGSGVRTTLVDLAEHAVAAAPVPTHGITHLDVHRAGDIEDACADLTLLRALGAPLPRWSTRDAVADFVRASWDTEGAPADAWDRALGELKERGLTS